MLGLARNPLEPGPDRRIACQVEAALGCRVCVPIKCDVSDRVAPAGEPVVPCQMSVHNAERGIAFGVPLRNEVTPLLEFLLGCIREPETRHRDVGLMTVLLEEHPLQCFGAAPLFGGQ